MKDSLLKLGGKAAENLNQPQDFRSHFEGHGQQGGPRCCGLRL